jgi:hypothetical protein
MDIYDHPFIITKPIYCWIHWWDYFRLILYSTPRIIQLRTLDHLDERPIVYWGQRSYHLIDRLIDYLRFYVPLKNFSLKYGDVTIPGEGLQNLNLCLALWAFEQGGIFIVSHLLRYGTSVFPVSSEGLPHTVASYDTWGCMWRIYSNPDPQGEIW